MLKEPSVRIASVALASLLVLAMSCSNDPPEAANPTPETSEPTESPTEHAGTITAKDFDPNDFDDSVNVDNEWFPLQPGTQWIYEGHSFEGNKRLDHRVVFTTTDLVKVVEGVRSVVAWDRDYTEGELVETELAFFAQDNDGNVWHLGQYPEEYENGKFDKAPAWIAGLKGARAGISMKAAPSLGGPSYAQGYAPPPINWIDRGRTYQTGVKTCVPVDCYTDVLVIEEFERDKPGAFQLKYYAAGAGNVRVGWRGRNEEEKEELVLVDLAQLSPEEMDKTREQALALEQRAYRISKDVYGQTQPAEQIEA